jgi:hypothetical protein
MYAPKLGFWELRSQRINSEGVLNLLFPVICDLEFQIDPFIPNVATD